MKGKPMLGSEAGRGDLRDGVIGGGEGSVCTPRFAAGVANSALPGSPVPLPQVEDDLRDGAIGGEGNSVCTPRFAAGVANSAPFAADDPCSQVVLGGAQEALVSSCEVRLMEAGGNRAGAVPARISLLYESRDGGICVFEDAEGHLTSVRASRLA